jgi:hypothetical protein
MLPCLKRDTHSLFFYFATFTHVIMKEVKIMTFDFTDTGVAAFISAVWNDAIRTRGYVTKYQGLILLKYFDYVPCYVDTLYGWTDEIKKENTTVGVNDYGELVIRITLPDWKKL